MSQYQRPSKKVVQKCNDIHTIIDELLPGTYAEAVQKRLASKGIEESVDRIYNARRLTIKNLPIMEEFLSYCKELYPEEFLNSNS